jgi:hypothetical protein
MKLNSAESIFAERTESNEKEFVENYVDTMVRSDSQIFKMIMDGSFQKEMFESMFNDFQS